MLCQQGDESEFNEGPSPLLVDSEVNVTVLGVDNSGLDLGTQSRKHNSLRWAECRIFRSPREEGPALLHPFQP